MENKQLSVDYEAYTCGNCSKKEVHYVEVWQAGNVYECSGCGHIMDTRPKEELKGAN